MRLIRNICKKCNDYNFLEREFNYELSLCNKCLKEHIMPEIRFKGYFNCNYFPSITGDMLDITSNGSYLATINGIYEIGNSFRNILEFDGSFTNGKFSKDGLYFLAYRSNYASLFSLKNGKWINNKDFNFEYKYMETYFFNKRKDILLLLTNNYNDGDYILFRLNPENGNLEKVLQEPIKKIIVFPNDTVLIFYSNYKKENVDLYDANIKKIVNRIPKELIPYVKIAYPIDNETLFVQKDYPYLLNVLKNNKEKLADEKIDLFLPKKNLLIDICNVFSNSGYSRLLYVYSLLEGTYIIKLYFPHSINQIGITGDNNILYVLTKNICHLISTINWKTIAKLEHIYDVKYCRILNNKSVITATEKGNIYFWNKIL